MVVANFCGLLGDMKSLGSKVLAGRFFMLFASILIMSSAGASYLFSLYSDKLKTSLGYDQKTLNLLSFFRESGGNIGIISGIINEFLPPWVVLSVGAVTNFFGYFMIWLAVTGRIPNPRVWHMCVYIAIAANSQTYVTTGVIVTCVKNFPASRGVVLALLTGYVGVSGAIITQLYHALSSNDANFLLLLMALILSVVTIIFLPTIRYMEVIKDPNEVKFCYNILYISLTLAGFIMGMIIIQNRVDFTRPHYAATVCIILILLLLPLALIFKEEFHIRDSKNQPHNEPSEIKIENPPSIKIGPPKRGDEHTISQAIFSIDMLLLFTSVACGLGGTLGAIDNLGQISDSLGYPTSSTTTFVSLVSIWNYLGRVGAGFGSEYLLKRHKFPRTLGLTFFLFLSCLGHLLIALAVPNAIYFASLIMGFCLGAQWPLMFAIISDLFGIKYYSTLVNFGTIASPVGSYIVNVSVIGRLYDREAVKQMGSVGLTRKAGHTNLVCHGVRCYRLSFLIVTVITLFGCMTSLVLVLRTRTFYRGDIYGKYKEDAKVAGDDMVAAVNGVGPVTLNAAAGISSSTSPAAIATTTAVVTTY